MAREIDYRAQLARLIATVELEADNFASDHVGPAQRILMTGRVERLRLAAAEARGFLKAADLPAFVEKDAA